MTYKIPFTICTLTIMMSFIPVASAEPKPDSIKTAWGDQQNGRFVNPILPADFSDLDAIRVGDDFYAITSTFQFSPGMTILHSTDLVNWKIVSHAINDLTQISPELNWDRMKRYGKGVWAGAIRFHDNRFWIYFGTPDEGFFVTSSRDIRDPWDKLTCIKPGAGWDDCCPFWDDDGQGYFVCTHFADQYKIYLFKMTPDNKSLVADSGKVIYQSRGSEASKLYKLDGTYYHYFSEVKSEGRVPMMRRAKSLDGPWEMQQLGHVNSKVDKEPNQGAFVELPEGKWWFLTHHGTGDWEGRTMSLIPVSWRKGWPIIGVPGDDGIGRMIWDSDKPIPGSLKLAPQMHDDFNSREMAPQWQWNYQPRNEKWSLAERDGFLRLHAFKPLKTGDLLSAGNTLTQRIYRTQSGIATILLDISKMTDGQQVGLCHFARDYSMLAIRQEKGSRSLFVHSKGKSEPAVPVSSDIIWLRATWSFDGMSQYSYSTDGKAFSDVGTKIPLTWSYYRGDRLGIFSFNDQSEGGYVDVDWFDCQIR